MKRTGQLAAGPDVLQSPREGAADECEAPEVEKASAARPLGEAGRPTLERAPTEDVPQPEEERPTPPSASEAEESAKKTFEHLTSKGMNAPSAREIALSEQIYLPAEGDERLSKEDHELAQENLLIASEAYLSRH